MLVVFFLVLVFFQSLSAHPIEQSADLDATSDLVFLQTVWRHGDRSPIWAAPNDPNQEETWPQGFGQLSTEGMQQHMNLGRKLRQRYAHFISPHYDSREVYVRSSDVNRTIMSAMANMVGFYGEGQDGVDYPPVDGWPRGFVPVPIHAVPEEFDYMRGMLKNCKRFQRILDMTEETPEFQRLEAENKETIEHLYSVLGTRDLPLRQFGVVADTWRIERHYNRPQTPGFTEELYKRIEPIGFRVNGFKYGMGVQPMNGVNFAVELARSHGGLFLWAIIEHMQQKRACHEQAIGNKPVGNKTDCEWMGRLKYHVFSAHDSTLAALFSAFGFAQTNHDIEGYPPYAACVTIELRRDRQSGRYFVDYILEDRVVNLTPDITGCGQSTCDLEAFAQRSLPFKLENIEEYCTNVPS
ncbi:Acid phosphatase [Aphelenchoides fujianensis]|nr:Acid phosphatase [Aphelenchoides fujianensis]